MFKSLFSLFSPSSARGASNTDRLATQPQSPPPVARQITNPQAGDGGIKRDENMVKKLTEDHRVLLGLYGQVMREADTAQWNSVQLKLVEFQSALTDHLLLETVKVYTYLKQRYKSDEDISASIHDFSSEMNVIRKHVFVTLAGFNDVSINEAKQKAFRGAWQGIGTALGSRIQREEKSLYPLY